MDIMADGDGWAFRLSSVGGFKYAVDKKTGSLSVVKDAKAKYSRDMLVVTTPRNVFIETIDANGDVIQEGGDGSWCHVPIGKAAVTIRYRKLPDPELTAAQVNRARRNVTRHIVDDNPDCAGVPDTLVGLIAWAKKHLKSIPEASREKATCCFDTSTKYGETYPHVAVNYQEPETDEEVIERVKVERERERLSKIAKRAKLEALKKELQEG